MPDTQECLLNAAEKLFVENGFAATSLRSIASAANANIAATNYHFGSKEGLLQAVVHRRVTPINEARLKSLDDLQTRGNFSLEDILHSFFAPLMTEEVAHLSRLISRIFSEPPSVSGPLIENEFGEVIKRYVAAIGQVLPDIPRDQLVWRFHFLVGSMLKTLSLDQPTGAAQPATPNEKFTQLICYSAAGFRAPLAGQLSGD